MSFRAGIAVVLAGRGAQLTGRVVGVIEVSVPVRICDIGGWTDTWFGGPGRVVNIAVSPGVSIFIGATTGQDLIVLDVENAGDRYTIAPGTSRTKRHPIVEAAIDILPPPRGLGIEVCVRSEIPAGCGTGTSAAIAVGLLGGLTAARCERRSPRDIAYAAHRLEVEVLGEQSGIQDQLSAAFGGINYLEIEAYPEATARNLPPWPELTSRLTSLFVGHAHVSSHLHRQVIDHVARFGSREFERLRDAAVGAREAVVARDLPAFGRAMIANTEAQRSLHPGLVGGDANRVIELAAAEGALGWKVNGAGGDGGSVTILSATQEARDGLERRIARFDPHYKLLDVRFSSTGLQVRGVL
jgi:D-glycero-alpha-D-manno-heptose-7-phosphate kinase